MMKSEANFIDKNTSTYLDVVRFIASFIVLIGHVLQDNKMNEDWYGHYAVIIFFVLSGLVIAETTARPGMTTEKYILARSARMLSVTIPAILFGATVLIFAPVFVPEVQGIAQRAASDLEPTSLLSSVLFLNESWSLRFDAPFNEPYWSICYEVIYYVIFGIWVFAAPRMKLPLLVLALLIAGPRVLALFPVWLTGVFLSRHWHKVRLGPLPSVLVFVGSAALFCLFISVNIGASIKDLANTHIPGWWRLDMSQTVITDILLGLLVAANFSAFRGISHFLGNTLSGLSPAIVYAASFTFSLYLFHRPLTHVYGAWAQSQPGNLMAHFVIQLAIITTVCALLGTVTEHKKEALKAWMKSCFQGRKPA